MYENNINSMADELPICDSTGTGTATSQLYGVDGIQHEARHLYDHSFQCQRIEDRTFLYAVCSGHKLASFAKERLACEIPFGQLNESTTESVKDILRLAFIALEKDFLNLIDQEVQQRYQLHNLNGLSDDETTQHSEKTERENQKLSIALALVHKSKLYICNVGLSRVILCKTDDQNVLRAVQLSSGFGNGDGNETVRLCEQSASITSQLEIVGPILIDDSCQFLVLMSCGLCKTLQELHANDVQQFIRSIVQQLRCQCTLTAVAQSVIDQIVAEHYDRHLNRSDESSRLNRRDELTLLVRKFNFHMPNLIQQIRNRPTVAFNPVDEEHLITNTSFLSSHPNTIDTTNSTAESCSEQTELYSKTLRPYVDFSEYYRNVERAQINGTLTTKIRFD